MNAFEDNKVSIELRTAIEAARAAAEISREYYAGNFTVTTKEDLTPVTQADVECEEKIREIILARFPEDGFFGEETGRQGGIVWMLESGDWSGHIDPLTDAFIALSGDDNSLNFGRTLMPLAPDLNSDGKGDLVVGDYGYATGGSVHVFFNNR